MTTPTPPRFSMKTSLLSPWLTLVFCCASLVCTLQTSVGNQWTNTDGVAIQGDFVKLEGDVLVIRKDGKESKIPLDKLSQQSHAQARRVAGLVTSGRAAPDAQPCVTVLPEHVAVPKEGAWRSGTATGFPDREPC